MASLSTGGPAFPNPHDERVQGLHMRDYFAIRAMAALLADPSLGREYMIEKMPDDAYLLADLMLKARKNGRSVR